MKAFLEQGSKWIQDARLNEFHPGEQPIEPQRCGFGAHG